MYASQPEGDFDEAQIQQQQGLVEQAVTIFAKIIEDEIQAGNINPETIRASQADKSEFGRPQVAEGRFGNIRP